MLAFALPGQVLFNGVILGLTYGVLAIGVILVFRSSRVINFAIAEMGAFGAVLLARLVINWDVPFLVAFAGCVIVGGLIGATIELGVVRRLFEAPRVILLVATIGVAQVLLFAEFSLPDLSRYADYPSPITESWHVGDVIVRGSQILVLVVIPLLTAALAFFLNRTKYGTAVRASAANADAARLSGISIKRMSTLVWVLAGILATVGAILTAPLNSATANDIGGFGPALLLRVLAAALIGRMVSLPWAVVGGVAIGVAETALFYNYPNQLGLLDMVLLVVVLVTLLPMARGGRLEGDSGRWSFSPRVRPIPARLEGLWWVRRLPLLGALGALIVALVPLVILTSPSDQFLFSRVLLYAIVALSVTLLTGWAGQLSLGQFAIVGVGAMSTASLVGRGLGFVPAVLISAVIAAVIAMIIGTPALRMPGLFLAVVTLAFAVAAPSWLLTQDVFTRGEDFVFMPRAVIGPVSLSSQGTYYLVCLLVLVLVVVAVARIRRSGFGRSLIAVRDNERGAAALGVSPMRVKLIAFATAGALAGLAGGLLAGLLVQFEPARFSATESLSVVAIAVIGGLASIPGAILGALWVVGLPSLFADSSEVALLTSGAGLLILLLYFPGGLIQVFYSTRDALFEAAARRLDARDGRPATDAVVATTSATTPTGIPRRAEPDVAAPVAIRIKGLSVAYGKRTVVDGVDLEVGRGETVGLIGSNGAGKSTLMNAIGGFVPSRGTIEVLGHDVGRVAPARRARLGLGRSFQGAELFSDLTVRETVQLALEDQEHAGLATIALGLPKARRVERSKRAHADEIIAFLGLGAFANRFVNELSTGTRRIVELACLVASGARVLCLDEPTAGIAQRETEAFGPLILRIREELDATLLVIEHDMPLVMSISDRVYCLELGQIICEGAPDTVRNDPRVIASYLGTDERAIARSGTTPS
jgi:ABC-type branched-subunit amino acid transport system ATPase component/ABC-type branched-subunit amino acid transport system permease subunit